MLGVVTQMETLISGMSVGAVGAAFVAAVVSILGLIISKENKVSDFSQAWIDALRIEVTSYLSNINIICDMMQVDFESPAEKVAKLGPHYSALNTANFMISLRLNPKEKFAAKIISCMNQFEQVLARDSFSPGDIKSVEGEFLLAAKSLLKLEWSRVKRGEWTFRIAKWLVAAVILLISAMVVAIWVVSYSEILTEPRVDPISTLPSEEAGALERPAGN